MMKFNGNKKNAKHVSKTSKGAKAFLWVGVSMLLAVCALLTAYKVIVRPMGQQEQLQTTPIITETQTQVDELTGEIVEIEIERPASHREGVYNILLCGTDNDGYRTDTIMIAHIDTTENKAALLSIPRDTVVIQEDKVAKINSVYGGAGAFGMDRLSKCLGQMLGFPMDGYVLINLNAFQEAVDLMGGVWFDVPQDMFYEDPTQDLYIDLKEGYQLLDGYNAMGLVRYRKGYLSQDIQRTQMQQQFLVEAGKQILSLENTSKINGFIQIFFDNVTTDMTIGNLVYFVSELAACPSENIETYTPRGTGATIDGLSYFPLDPENVLEIVNTSFNPYDVDLEPEHLNVITEEMALAFLEDPEGFLAGDDDWQKSSEIPEAEMEEPIEGEEILPSEETQDQPPKFELDEFGMLPEDWYGELPQEEQPVTEEPEIGDASLWDADTPHNAAEE